MEWQICGSGYHPNRPNPLFVRLNRHYAAAFECGDLSWRMKSVTCLTAGYIARTSGMRMTPCSMTRHAARPSRFPTRMPTR